MLERVFEVGEEPHFVEELCRLKRAEAPRQVVLRQVCHGLQQHVRHVFADDGSTLEHALLVGIEAVDTRGDDGLDRRWNLDIWRIDRELIRATLADQHARLDERPRAFFQEERVAARPRDQDRLERREMRMASDQAVEQEGSIIGHQRRDLKLMVVGLLPHPWRYSGR